MTINIEKLKSMTPPTGMDFHIGKVGHIVLQVSDLERSTAFYTQVLGLQSLRRLPRNDDARRDGFSALQHGPSLPGSGRRRRGTSANRELHHFAFEVPTLAEVIRARDRLRANQVQIDFEGRRRAGCQIAVEFRDPDNHSVEIYWGVDQVGSDGRVRPAERMAWGEITGGSYRQSRARSGHSPAANEFRLSFSRGYDTRIFAQPW